jgi:yecA family protein
MINFEELESACLQGGLSYTAAEIHGILTGLLCSPGVSDPETWLGRIDEHPTDEADDNGPWSQLYQNTLAQLAGDTFDFRLLLPADDTPLRQRTEALADWCRGFLYGISNGNLQQKMELSDNVTEIIEDLTQISRAGHDEDDEDEEGEAAYMELVEYIRAGTMLIYAELHTPPTPPTDRSKLH